MDFMCILQHPNKKIGVWDGYRCSFKDFKRGFFLFTLPLNPQCHLMNGPIIRLIEGQPFIMKGVIDLNSLLHNLFTIIDDREDTCIFFYMFFCPSKVVV